MNADRTRTRGRTCLAFAGLFAAVMGVSLVTLPSHVSAAPQSAEADAEEKPASPVKNTHSTPDPNDRKNWYKVLHHPPELPNAAYLLVGFAPETAVGKYLAKTENMFLVRPIFALIVLILAAWIASAAYRKRSVLPGRLQVGMEMVVEALDNLFTGVLGKEVGRAYLPFLGALFIYILLMNLIGLFPGALSPTSWICTTAALAIATFFVVQYTAFSKLGVKGVIMHWLGNPTDGVTWVIGIIFLPLHVFGEFVKPLSLSLRLYGNIFGEDVLLGSMLMLGVMIFSFLPAQVPIGFPLQLPFMFLATLTSTIQALVFTLLSTIYILMVLPHGDHEHDEHHDEAHAHS